MIYNYVNFFRIDDFLIFLPILTNFPTEKFPDRYFYIFILRRAKGKRKGRERFLTETSEEGNESQGKRREEGTTKPRGTGIKRERNFKKIMGLEKSFGSLIGKNPKKEISVFSSFIQYS